MKKTKAPHWTIWELFGHHHDAAARSSDHSQDHNHEQRMERLAAGRNHALLAQANVQRGIARELRKIRGVLETIAAQHSNATAALNLSGQYVTKEGAPAMPIGAFNPSPTQNVKLSIAPKNAAGDPTSGPFAWTSSNNALVAVTPSEDGKTAICVVTEGIDIDALVSVSDPRTGVTDSATFSRVAPPPPDNNTTELGLTGEYVDKA